MARIEQKAPVMERQATEDVFVELGELFTIQFDFSFNLPRAAIFLNELALQACV